MTPQEAQIKIAARVNDRAFFRAGRIWHALRRDPTINVEVLLAILLVINGALIWPEWTTYPPEGVEFLLRSWLVTEQTLGMLFVGLGVLQGLGTGTRSHRLRGVIAVAALMVSCAVMMAYFFAGLSDQYHAWVMYLGITIREFFVAIRNFGDHHRVRQARAFLQTHLGHE